MLARHTLCLADYAWPVFLFHMLVILLDATCTPHWLLAFFSVVSSVRIAVVGFEFIVLGICARVQPLHGLCARVAWLVVWLGVVLVLAAISVLAARTAWTLSTIVAATAGTYIVSRFARCTAACDEHGARP